MEQILIIEDDMGLNQGLCRALKSENRQVISCLNLKTAREQLLCGNVSLVLLDINLPDGSGLDFLKELKAADPVRPVILLTANDTDMDIVAGLEQGADDYRSQSRFPCLFCGQGSIHSCVKMRLYAAQRPFKLTAFCFNLIRCSFPKMECR